MLATGCVPAELSEVVVSRLTMQGFHLLLVGLPLCLYLLLRPPAALPSTSGVSQSVGAEPPSVAASSLPIY